MLKQQPTGARLFTKQVYDGLGRKTKTYSGHDLAESSYADAGTVVGDTIVEQTEVTYDAASKVIQNTVKQRYHNATGTGELTGPSGVQPKARVTYSASWPDPLGRQQAAADYGTNGGSALSRPATIPARSDAVLVTSQDYNSAGQVAIQTNPAGISTCLFYDAAGRQIVMVMSGSVVNEVQFAYNDFGQITHDYQAHVGAVSTSATPKVQYGYASGSANTIRPTSITYPDGRVITYGYGSSDSMADVLSRVAAIIDSDAGATHLAD